MQRVANTMQTDYHPSLKLKLQAKTVSGMGCHTTELAPPGAARAASWLHTTAWTLLLALSGKISCSGIVIALALSTLWWQTRLDAKCSWEWWQSLQCVWGRVLRGRMWRCIHLPKGLWYRERSTGGLLQLFFLLIAACTCRGLPWLLATRSCFPPGVSVQPISGGPLWPHEFPASLFNVRPSNREIRGGETTTEKGFVF